MYSTYMYKHICLHQQCVCTVCPPPVDSMAVLQADAVDESIVYVSEPQPLAHSSEEVIDMVENPVTSDVQVQLHVVPLEV